MNKAATFEDIINHRRSVRVFDSEKELDVEVVKKCIENATLAPNSSNMQLWEFYHITSKNKLEKLSEACFNQNAASTAKQMVVIVVRKDLWKQRVKQHQTYLKTLFGNKESYSKREKFALNYYKKIVPFVYSEFLGIYGFIKHLIAQFLGIFKPMYRQVNKSDMRVVAHKSTGLAAQTFMLGMASYNYDTCPMEGFDSLRVKNALSLPKKSEINMIIACGIRKPEGIYGERFRIPFEQVYKQL